MYKSLITNLIAIVFIVAGFFSPWGKEQLLSVGFFALSGAITNWLAIYMLFERVPLLYGSGVIPRHFEDIKTGLKNMAMEQFFSDENIDSFLSDGGPLIEKIDFEPIVAELDLDAAFDTIVREILNSKFGGMLDMFGGPKLLEGYREPIKERIRNYVAMELSNPLILEKISAMFSAEDMKEQFLEKVETLIENRLDMLTPKQVKEIVQDMIRMHLGWLVVWGGVMGGLIGLAMSFVNIAGM